MEDKKISTQRLEILIAEMIMNNLTGIDFNNEEERYLAFETLLYKTIVEGEFDDIFLSENLEGLSKEERKNVLNLARQYNSLCFYRGDFDYWLDSVEGVTNSETYMTAELLLRNYDYLIRLAKNGGKEVLELLKKFEGSGKFNNSSVVATLLLKFCDTNTLETILKEMAKEDGEYKDFSVTQKVIMCDAPDGVLYRQDENNVEIITVKELKKIISNNVGEEDYPMKDIDSETFEGIVLSIFHDYSDGKVLEK